ncbi:MAG: hypothetical protein ABIJ21_07315 [Nanoarchaeota archaeon]
MGDFGVVMDNGKVIQAKGRGDWWEITIIEKGVLGIKDTKTVQMWKITMDPKGEFIRVVVDRVREHFQKGMPIPEMEQRLKVIAEGRNKEDIIQLIQNKLG